MPTTVPCRTIECEFIDVPTDSLTFRPAAYGVVARGTELLLVKFPHLAQYTLPGGGMEVHELAEDTVEREVKEETGYDVEVGDLLHFHQEFFQKPQTGNNHNSISLFFLCEPKGEPSVAKGPDFADAIAEWVDVSQERHDLHPFIQGVVDRFRKSKGLV